MGTETWIGRVCCVACVCCSGEVVLFLYLPPLTRACGLPWSEPAAPAGFSTTCALIAYLSRTCPRASLEHSFVRRSFLIRDAAHGARGRSRTSLGLDCAPPDRGGGGRSLQVGEFSERRTLRRPGAPPDGVATPPPRFEHPADTKIQCICNGSLSIG